MDPLVPFNSGLRWQDVDLSAGTLTVRNALQRIDGEWQFVPPKTERSRRKLLRS